MSFLLSGVIASLGSTVIAGLVFTYLFVLYRERHIGYLAGMWWMYTVKLSLDCAVTANFAADEIMLYNRLFVFLGGCLLLAAVLSFQKKNVPLWLWFLGGLLAFLPAGVAFYQPEHTGWLVLNITVNSVLYLMVAYQTILCFLSNRLRVTKVMRVIFILWGVIFLVYPFARGITPLLPFAYYFGAITKLVLVGLVVRRHTEAMKQALQVYSLGFDMLAENTQDVVYRFRFEPDDAFEYINPAIERLSGYKPEAFLKDPQMIFRVVHPDDHERLMSVMSGRAMFDGPQTFRWVAKDGRIVWTEAVNVPIRDQNTQSLIAMQGIMRDITWRVEQEQERALLESRIQEAEKVQSLGKMAGGIAHDFNNLLSVILGNTGLAVMDLPSDSPVLPLLKETQAATMQASNLVEKILAYSGRGKALASQVELNKVVQDTLNNIRSTIPEGIAVQMELAEQSPVFVGDRTQLGLAVKHVVENAIEAMESQQGRLLVRTGLITCENHEKLTPGDYEFIMISDTGTGISDTVQGRIFDPFFSTKFHGRGLGLSAVFGIVHGHGGTVDVSSTMGEGSTFTLLLPSSPLAEDYVSVS